MQSPLTTHCNRRATIGSAYRSCNRWEVICAKASDFAWMLDEKLCGGLAVRFCDVQRGFLVLLPEKKKGRHRGRPKKGGNHTIEPPTDRNAGGSSPRYRRGTAEL